MKIANPFAKKLQFQQKEVLNGIDNTLRSRAKMELSELSEATALIKQPPASEWQVVHLRYPRETEIVSSLKIKWVVFGKLKVPKFFFQQKRVEKQEASVNYDLLCSQMESLLNDYAAKGYELFSTTSTHSGFSAIVSTSPRPQSHLFKPAAAKTSLRAEEALVLIFRKRSIS